MKKKFDKVKNSQPLHGINALHQNNEESAAQILRSQGELGRAIKYLQKNVKKENQRYIDKISLTEILP